MLELINNERNNQEAKSLLNSASSEGEPSHANEYILPDLCAVCCEMSYSVAEAPAGCAFNRLWKVTSVTRRAITAQYIPHMLIMCVAIDEASRSYGYY